MDESANVENEKQKRQKPPRNLGRIACEILAGAALGLAVAYPVLYVIFYVIFSANADMFKGCFGGFAVAGIYFLACPMVYGPASTVGVYLVGTRGKQTGSFLLILVGGFLAGLVILPVFFFANLLGKDFIGIEKIGLWAPVFLIPPILATIGFNLTRRYKEPPSS